MTPIQRQRLRRSDVTPKARDYVRLMDRFNHTDDLPQLRRLTIRTQALVYGPGAMTNDEYAVASHLLHIMQREDDLRAKP